MPEPQPLTGSRHSDSHMQRLQIPSRLCPLVVCVFQRVGSPSLCFPAFWMLSSDPPALCPSRPSSAAATDPGKIVGSRTLAGAKFSEWDKQNASGWVEPSAELGTEGALVTRGGEAWVSSSQSLPLFPLQAPVDPDQASVSASSEWQRKLEAAEALLILRDSPQAPPGYISPL